MFLSHSTGRKVLVTAIAAVVFAVLYEVPFWTLGFARPAGRPGADRLPRSGVRLRFTATGYCRGTTTASGVNVRSGIAAADPDLLPVGSVVQIDRLATATTASTRSWTPARRSRAAPRHLHVELQRGPGAGAAGHGRLRSCDWAGIRGPARPGWSIASSGSARPSLAAPARPDPDRSAAELAGRSAAGPAVSRRLLPLLVLELELIQLVVDPPPRQQLLVGSRLPQLPLVQDQDLVHVLDGREPMRDRDASSVPPSAP